MVAIQYSDQYCKMIFGLLFHIGISIGRGSRLLSNFLIQTIITVAHVQYYYWAGCECLAIPPCIESIWISIKSIKNANW